MAHALGFARAAAAYGGGPGDFVDLGSGGGLPGLVLAAEWPTSRVLLVEANQRRAEALRRALDELGWGHRVQVLRIRAEEAGRDPALRGSQTLVVARSFGPPAVVAECGAPLLRLGGLLVVSEPPPGAGDEAAAVRWPSVPLGDLGLEATGIWQGEFGYQVLTQVAPCPTRYPRRPGIPAKRPLFG